MKKYAFALLAAAVVGCSNISTLDLPITPVLPGTAAAVCVGLTQVDPKMYGGWDGECPGCDLDCRRMSDLCRSLGYSSVVTLTNSEATAYRVIAQFVAAAASLKPAADRGWRPLLFVAYSGHGGQVPDVSGDEADKLDETICLWDGRLIDDLLYAALCKVPAGVRVVFFADSCNSASVYKTRYAQRFERYLKARASRVNEMECELLMLSGCADGKSSIGTSDGGLWSNAWLASWQAGTWAEAAEAAKKLMPRDQTPVVTYVGGCDPVDPKLPDMEAMR